MSIILVTATIVILLAIFSVWEAHQPPFIKEYRTGYNTFYAVLKRGGMSGWFCITQSGRVKYIGNPYLMENLVLFETEHSAEEARLKFIERKELVL